MYAKLIMDMNMKNVLYIRIDKLFQRTDVKTASVLLMYSIIYRIKKFLLFILPQIPYGLLAFYTLK